MPALPFLSKLLKPLAEGALKLSTTPLSVGKSSLVSAGIGSATGAVGGYMAAPEDRKGKGVLTGALLGGAGGALFGRGLAKGLATGGDTARLQAFGNELKNIAATGKTNTEMFKGLGNALSKNFADPNHLTQIGKYEIPGPQHRPAAGFYSKSPINTGLDKNPRGFMLFREFGNQAKNLMSVVEKGHSPAITGDTAVRRVGQVVGHNVQEARTYIRDGRRYKRSLLGQGAAILGTTGVGFGAIDAATKTNDDGTPASLPSKLMTGASTSLKWSVGAPIMGTKAMFYDIPKMIINPEG